MSARTLALLIFLALLIGPIQIQGQDAVKDPVIKSPTETAATDSSDERAEEEEEEEEEAGGKPEKAEQLSLNGTFAPENPYAIKIETEEWSALKIDTIAEHGAKVEAGQVILELETDDLEKAIHDAELEQDLGRLALEQAEHRLEILRKKSPLELAEAERAAANATQDLQQFLTKEREQTKESLEYSVTSSENRLAYEEEELKQLERMYEADEITEETEEIILRRTRDTVKSARFQLKRARQSRDKSLGITLDRTQKGLEKAVADTTLALEQARIDTPNKIRKTEIDLDQMRIKRERADEKLDRLRSDAKQLSVKSPIAGYVYLGDITDGDAGGVAAAIKSNKQGSSIKSKQVVLTVVAARPMSLRAKIAEEKLSQFSVGMAAKVIPTAFPKQELNAAITEISTIPTGVGEFSVTLSVEIPDELNLMPGMKGKIVFDVDSEEGDSDKSNSDSNGDE